METNNNSMILDIINDLVRMRQNLDFMDDSVKGVSQLKNRIKSIYATLNSNQYDIPDLVGHSYHEGDNMIGTLELNPELPPATNRIKRVIKPQVSYQGKLIQAAEVIIEYNE
ncbi:MAG: hypothetical protein IKG96_00270 [Bacteroidaceae bacterium]|nr:hypothetical protein [Bacteroidaceae bacterium]